MTPEYLEQNAIHSQKVSIFTLERWTFSTKSNCLSCLLLRALDATTTCVMSPTQRPQVTIKEPTTMTRLRNTLITAGNTVHQTCISVCSSNLSEGHNTVSSRPIVSFPVYYTPWLYMFRTTAETGNLTHAKLRVCRFELTISACSKTGSCSFLYMGLPSN